MENKSNMDMKNFLKKPVGTYCFYVGESTRHSPRIVLVHIRAPFKSRLKPSPKRTKFLLWENEKRCVDKLVSEIIFRVLSSQKRLTYLGRL